LPTKTSTQAYFCLLSTKQTLTSPLSPRCGEMVNDIVPPYLFETLFCDGSTEATSAFCDAA
jgi:hypothetical protein